MCLGEEGRHPPKIKRCQGTEQMFPRETPFMESHREIENYSSPQRRRKSEFVHGQEAEGIEVGQGLLRLDLLPDRKEVFQPQPEGTNHPLHLGIRRL